MAIKVKAVFSADAKENARQPDIARDSSFTLIVRHNGEMHEAVCARTYFNQRGNGMNPVRACVWIKPADRNIPWRSGRGSASGCGYHKESAAIADAFSSAGVTLYGNPYGRDKPDMKREFDFGGTGSNGYREIFEAIARAAGYTIRKGSSTLVQS